MKPNIARRRIRNHHPPRDLLAWRDGRRVEALERGRLVGAELAALDRSPRPGGQIEQKSDVVLGQKYQAEQLLLIDEMTEIGAREASAGRAGAALVERARVAGEAGVPEVEAPFPRERRAGAPEPRRQNAVEHVDPALDDVEDPGRVADAHEVARPLARKERRRPLDGVEHRPRGPPPRSARRARGRRSRARRSPPIERRRSSRSMPPWVMPKRSWPSALRRGELARRPARRQRRRASRAPPA